MPSAASVAKIPYRDAADGISLTTTLVPKGLGRVPEDRITNLTAMLDAFFGVTGYHMNVNVSIARRCSTRWIIRRNIRASRSASPATR